jgi:hypothetical protein
MFPSVFHPLILRAEPHPPSSPQTPLTRTENRFVSVSVGGPALIYYVSPTEEELFSRYNPELQKRSLENRLGKQEDFDHFVGKLKEYSRSDKPSSFPL